MTGKGSCSGACVQGVENGLFGQSYHEMGVPDGTQADVPLALDLHVVPR